MKNKRPQPTTWVPVIRQLKQRAEAEAERWASAYRTRYTSDRNAESPVMVEIKLRYQRAKQAANSIGFVLTLEEVGRDVGNLENEILSCFTRKGEHRAETISKRLFDPEYADHTSGDNNQWIENQLKRLAKEGRLYTRLSGHGDWLYMLRTPERTAKLQAAAIERKRQAAQEKIRAARETAVLSTLERLGCISAKPERYGDGITMSLGDIERLLEAALDPQTRVA